MLTTAPTFEHLYRLFPDSPDRPTAAEVPADDVPEPYHQLLVHTHHMTVTVERFYGSPVNVRVLNCRRAGNEYARKILLTLKDDSRAVVQFGLVRINLGDSPPMLPDYLEVISTDPPAARMTRVPSRGDVDPHIQEIRENLIIEFVSR